MKKISALALALVLVLSLAACGGNENEPSDNNSTTPPPSTSAGTSEELSPKDDTISDSTSSEPKPGDFLYWNLTAAEGPDEQIWGFALCFQGDTTQANPQFGDVAVSIDGARVDTPEYTMESTYYADFDRTDYAVYFTLQPGEMQKKPAQYVLEITCNGVNLRHPTIDWQADGTITISEDSPIPALNILSETTQSPSASGGDTQPTPGAAVQDIPDNGTPPTVTAPLESHAGDKAYFYTLSDDYIVWIEEQDDHQVYFLFSFDSEGNTIDGPYGSSLIKYIFTSETDAAAFAAQGDRFVQIGNAVYIDPSLATGPSMGVSYDDTKDNVFSHAQGYDYYLSKP